MCLWDPDRPRASRSGETLTPLSLFAVVACDTPQLNEAPTNRSAVARVNWCGRALHQLGHVAVSGTCSIAMHVYRFCRPVKADVKSPTSRHGKSPRPSLMVVRRTMRRRAHLAPAWVWPIQSFYKPLVETVICQFSVTRRQGRLGLCERWCHRAQQKRNPTASTAQVAWVALKERRTVHTRGHPPRVHEALKNFANTERTLLTTLSLRAGKHVAHKVWCSIC